MKNTKAVPLNDRITLKELLITNGWDKDKIPVYLGTGKLDNRTGELIFSKSQVKIVEAYLSKPSISINYRKTKAKQLDIFGVLK